MRVPESVEVLGRSWELRAVPGLLEDEVLFGDCNQYAELLRYAPEQTKQSLRDTVLHETVHAIDMTLSLGLTERQVANLSTVLLDVLRRNPGFTKLLLSK